MLNVYFVLGRVLVGWFSDFSWVNSLFVTNMAILLSGVSVLCMPFCVSYTSFVCVALMFGLYVAAYISLTSIILVDLVCSLFVCLSVWITLHLSVCLSVYLSIGL